MAAPADVSVFRATENGLLAEGELAKLVTEFNKLVTNLRVLTAKMDLDAGITDTNYAALVTDSAASGPAKLSITVG